MTVLNVQNKPLFIGVLVAAGLTCALFAQADEADPAAPAAETSDSASQAATPEPVATLDFANGLYARKMYSAATDEYAKFIAVNPDSTEVSLARFRLADSKFFLKDYANAALEFESFLKDFPTDSRAPLARFRIASAYLVTDRATEATPLFLALSVDESDPNLRAASLFYLAKCLEKQGQDQAASARLEKLIKLYPHNEYAAYAALALGDQKRKAGDSEGAIHLYETAARQKQPVRIVEEALFRMAELFFEKGDFKRSRDGYEKIFSGAQDETTDTHALTQHKAQVRDRALLGLFYCDYKLADLDAIRKRAERFGAWVQTGPHSAEVLFLLGDLLAEKNEPRAALNYLEAAASSKDSVFAEKALFKKAEVLNAAGRLDDAVKTLDRVRAQSLPAGDRAGFEQGRLLQEQGRFQEAVPYYRSVVIDFPDSPFAAASIYQAARSYLKLDDAAKARELFVRYLKENPTSSEAEKAELEIIQIDLDAKDYKIAAQNTASFLKSHPRSAFTDIALYKRGVALAGLGQYAEAADSFEKVTLISPISKLQPEALYGAGASFENSGRPTQAIERYEKLTTVYPQHPLTSEALPRLGYLYIRTNQIDKVSTLYQNLLFNRPDVRLDSDGVFWLIQYLLDRGEYQTMQQVVEALPKRFPGKDFGHETAFFLGESAMGLKDYPSAKKNYEEAIRLKPNGPYAGSATLGLGLASVMTGDFAEAEKNFNAALQFDNEPKITMRARFEQANLFLRASRPADAAKMFMLVAILYDDPKYTPTALFKAAECFESLGQSDESEKTAIELKTRYPESSWAKKWVEEHRGKA